MQMTSLLITSCVPGTYTLVFLQPDKVGLLLFYRRESLTGGQSGLQNLGCPLPWSIFADLGGEGYARLWASEKPLFHLQWLIL